MADSVILREYLVQLGFRVDEAAQRRFTDAITSMSNAVIGLGAGVAGAASAVVAAVANMANSASQMQYLSLTVNDTVNNIDALSFAWQKLGIAPQQTMAALSNLANMMRTNPGLAGLWQQYAGTGSVTEQLQHFGERFAQMTQGQQFVIRQQFEKILGPDFFNAFLTRGTQVGGGVQEFNFARRLFHFDPDEFARQSTLFERAWQSFQLRLNDLAGHEAQPILERMTAGLQTLSNWLDHHADQIISTIDDIQAAVANAFRRGEAVATGWISWFRSLPDDKQRYIEAIASIMAAFVLPSTAGSILAIFTLFHDYQQTMQPGGHSVLGIDWQSWKDDIQGVGSALSGLITIVNDLTGAFGTGDAEGKTLNWAVKTFIEMMVAGRFLGPIGQAIVLAKELHDIFDSIVSSIESLFERTRQAARLRSLGPNPTQAQIDWAMHGAPGQAMPQGPSTTEQLEQIPGNIRSWWSRHAPGLPGGLPANQVPQGGTSAATGWLGSLWHMLIPQAEAAEMPANIKALSMNVAKLNDTLSDMTDNGGTGGFGSWATGLGAGIVGHLFGGGASGGEDAVKSITDPKAIEAVKYLMSKGVPMHQAIGMVSNMMAESGLSTTVVNTSGHAGLRQWDRQRQATFQALYGKPLTSASMHEQLDFAQWEQEHSEARAGFMLRQAGDALSATVADYRFNERPGADDRSLGKRLSYAKALGADPRLQGDSFQAGNTITQNNNVTINTSADPNEVGRAWDEYNRRHWADLQRNQQGAFQ